ncbi:MAG: hypothetical protein ACTSUV_06365 [Candidatus Ranarchaeia archaeon]
MSSFTESIKKEKEITIMADKLVKTNKPKFFEVVKEAGTKNPFLLVVYSFIGSFLFARLFTFILPSFQLHLVGIHIHHYYFGVLFLLVSGGLIAFFQNLDRGYLYAILYGTGLGLIINQIGELFTYDYWSPITYFAFVFTTITLLILSIINLKTEFKKKEKKGMFLKLKNLSDRILTPFMNQSFVLVFLSFILSFTLARVYVISFPTTQFWVSNIHFHHYNLGIIFLLLSAGYILMIKRFDSKKEFLIMYGIGIGVFMDEIGLQLSPLELYWDPSTYIFIVITAIILAGVIAVQFGLKRGNKK